MNTLQINTIRCKKVATTITFFHLETTVASFLHLMLLICETFFHRISQSPVSNMGVVVLSVEHSTPDQRAWVRGSRGETPLCTVHAKSVVDAMFSKFPFKIIPLGVPKRRSHPLPGGLKLWWHVSRAFLGMNPRPSATAHCFALVRH